MSVVLLLLMIEHGTCRKVFSQVLTVGLVLVEVFKYYQTYLIPVSLPVCLFLIRRVTSFEGANFKVQTKIIVYISIVKFPRQGHHNVLSCWFFFFKSIGA